MLLALLPLSVFVLWLNQRKDPHIERVLDHDYVTGVIEDEVLLAELEASGPGAVEALRWELRRRFNPLLKAEQLAFDWFYSQGATAFNNGYSPIQIFDTRRGHALRGLVLLGEQALPAQRDVEAMLSSSRESQSLGTAALCAMRPHDDVQRAKRIEDLGAFFQKRRGPLESPQQALLRCLGITEKPFGRSTIVRRDNRHE